MIKALIHQLKYETAIDRNRLPEKIKEIDEFAEKNQNKVEQAVLYSLLADLYQKYYSDDFWDIRTRTAISGYVPEDIREWSANLFMRKISDLVDLSLVPAKELQQTSALNYETILNLGEASRELRPTLYDFLIYKGIASLEYLNNDFQIQNYFPQTKLIKKEYFAPANEFINVNIATDEYDFSPKILKLYQDLLRFKISENNAFSLLVADLDRLDFVLSNWVGESGEQYYTDALNKLKEKQASSDIVVEVLYRETRYLEKYTKNQEQPNENVRKIYETAQEGIRKYPKYQRIGLLKNLLTQLTAGSLWINADNVVYPGKELKLKIHYRNTDKISIEIYKINAPVTVYKHNRTRKGEYEKTGKLIKKETINLDNEAPYLYSDTIIQIPMEELGNYEFVVKSQKYTDIINQQFSVSRLGSISRTIDTKREFLIVDRISGKPIENAQINLYSSDNHSLKLQENIVSNEIGLAEDEGLSTINTYNVISGDDAYLITSPTPWISTYSESTKSNKVSIFTDRSIYRPGQTVYFKGIAYDNAVEPQIVSNKKYILSLKDANYKEIATKEVLTNEFGSFSGAFIIPPGSLTGNYTIESNEYDGYTSFQVEEYKRPTFDIRFNPNDKTYNFGNKVIISGDAKTFSGVNLQNTKIKYRVVRYNHRLYRGIFQSPVQISDGDVLTDENGGFEISFVPEKAFNDRNNDNAFYQYEIDVVATGTTGESQNSSVTINIGTKSMYLSFYGLDQSPLTKENIPAMKIQAFNLNDKEIETSGTYEIYRLNNDGKLGNNQWELGEQVLSGNFSSGKEIDQKAIKNLASGKYRIIAKTNDSQNREVQSEQDFVFASQKDKKPPIPSYKWIMTPKTTCEIGENAEIIFGSSAKDVSVLYEIFRDKNKLSASRFVLNNENKKIEIPFLESFGEGITVVFSFVKDEKFFTETIEVRKKQSDKSLDLKMEVFRDKLLPGQKEEWKISVRDGKENPVVSELLAGMYDASLDKIYSHSWSFNPIRSISFWKVNSRTGNEFNFSFNMSSESEKQMDVPKFNYDSFNWFGFNIRKQSLLFGGQNLRSHTVPVAEERMIVIGSSGQEVDQGESRKKESKQENSKEIQIRQNFNETAFFYPQLKTNEQGETLISFIVPESNTTWKFTALAHTKDLKFGQLIKTAISQKKLMVAPHVPRFIREGDKTNISADVSNLSDEVISGKVFIEFFDPSTSKQTIQADNSSKEFSLEPGKTTTFDWSFDVPSGIDLTTFKIVAQSATFSDGEQHLIPVLSNRMMVTESLPLNISSNQTKNYTFDKLANHTSSSLSNYRLTLEFAENPAWYAVQALSTIVTPQNDHAIAWFGSFYSNVLATHLANNTPKIKETVNAWIKQGETKETLLSDLEKNQELKTFVLEETPWVMEAKTESEQKQSLASLFDLNRASNFNSQALEKLKSLQATDGGWVWFKGMSSSTSITQWILCGLGKLSEKGILPQDDSITSMQLSAIEFIDYKFNEYFENIKKSDKKWKSRKSISTYELEYLYTRSFYADIPLEKSKEATDFFMSLTEKYWTTNTSIYARAIAAMVLQRNGNVKTAREILQSLREHATHHPETGMYWANNNTNVFMTQDATCTHTYVMEAFNEIGSDDKEMDEMKVWLLKQKQTQQWENVPATVNAIRVLLETGNNWLNSSGNVTIQLGDKKINTTPSEIGTGYRKQIFDANSIKPEMANIKIDKLNEGPGWGALYWQYFEDLDKITSAKTELNVEKILLVEKTTSTGKTWVPVSESNPLKTGDKVIVRLTVRSDRDMEFVHLKDMRASCFEPADQLSGMQWQQGLIYYRAPKDASMNFYFSALPKGTYTLEYHLYVTRSGNYSTGTTTIQCMYAPEFISHTAGGRVIVE
ncbi:MAG: hypothetical protein LBH12_01390 [Dysgonamonadaceae bacterium]|nr:hypothetical protein [Dysgonamonadaceae bacterium]